jgi:hypothetical protein
VWQLFEELRDKLAAQYQELQQKKQVRLLDNRSKRDGEVC